MRHSTIKSFSAEPGRVLFLAMLALIIYTPLPLAGNRPWALALSGVLTGCLLLCAIWGSVGFFAAWRNASFPLTMLMLWMLLLSMQLVPMPYGWLPVYPLFEHITSHTISIDPYSTRLYLAKTVMFTAVYWLLVSLVNSPPRIILLAKVVVLSGLLQALSGVILMANGTRFQWFFVNMEAVRAHGSFVSPNHFAGYLEMTLAMGIGLMIAKLDGRSASNWRGRLNDWMLLLLSDKAMLRLGLIIMVVGLVASRSRGGNLAFLGSLLITGILTVLTLAKTSQHINGKANINVLRSTIVFLLSLIVLDVLIIGGVVGVDKVVQRIEHTNMQTLSEAGGRPLVPGQEQSFEERGEAVMPALQLVRDFPWTGTGGGTFYLAFPHYQPKNVQGYFDHPHNDYVEFAADAGLPGWFMLAAMVLHSFRRSYKLLAGGCDQLAKGMAFASMMGMLSLLIHSAVDFNLQIPANAMMFLLLSGLPYLFAATQRVSVEVSV